tara:strand:+ start:75 stop:215 length:141 start_codon:yes stop_codon:yes gene_type:complete
MTAQTGATAAIRLLGAFLLRMVAVADRLEAVSEAQAAPGAAPPARE